MDRGVGGIGMGDPEEERAVVDVLMLPWLAHGHLSPFLELAKRLSHNNILLHFCSTPVNLSSVKQQLDQSAFPNLHTTKYLPSHLMPALKTAFDLSEPAFSRILEELRPQLLIYDFIQPWAPRAANRLNIPAVLFLTTGAAATAFFYHHLTKQPDHGHKVPFFDIPLSQDDHHNIICTHMFKRVANGISDADRLLECVRLSSDFVAIKTFTEIESKYLDSLSSLISKELVPVGPLVPDTMDEGRECSRRLIQWLNDKERSSVLFVSFGTEYFMTDEEIEEIAQGLEQSKVSFIWVVRFPEHEGEGNCRVQGGDHKRKNEACAVLEGIGSDDRGLIVEGWAPQREILNHPSTGGFLSHCGWSSVMEGMRFGIPLVAMPLQLDQPLNAKLVVELGVGVEIEGELSLVNNNNDDARGTPGFRRMFKREEILKGILQIFSSTDQGMGLRKKAKEMAELMGFKRNQEISFLAEKLSLLRMGGKERGC
ncbi:LOW QUALITY PROTEIN: flavanone 7-O-glucoside 2''-O-beta-L-rhamnosyltransferase-like [Asparagus officinalis]|nr:LOW QUALITY PROTEIN: flavanone 7-O-glucoside 2''-O-beta-L-rhamnosyltransferase-like [Asparagus officinalis]